MTSASIHETVDLEPERAPTPRPPRSREWRGRLGDAAPLLITAALLAAAPMVLGDFRLSLLARFLAFAVLAVGLDIVWGYGGMLSLGHGLFFGLGGYAMAMHLKLEASGTMLPDFMQWSDVDGLPWFWVPFRSAGLTLLLAVLVPALLAGLLGYMVFRNRIRGAYFAILTQATVLIFVTLLVARQGLTGGTNGITNFSTIFGRSLYLPGTRTMLYWTAALLLLVTLAGASWLMRTRFGRLLVACRDGEDRVRFLGYDPTWVKTGAFAISAGLAGLAGAIYVPIVGIIAPGMIGIVPSIQMVIWVALGGRASLYGPALGAVLFGFAQVSFAETLPGGWLYLQGALLILVLMVVPKGLAGIGSFGTTVRARLGRSREAATS